MKKSSSSPSLIIEADRPSNGQQPLSSKTLSFSGTPTPTYMSTVTGPNLLSSRDDIDGIKRKLEFMGFKYLKALYMHYGDGSTKLVLIYCVTNYGQYVFVEPPRDTAIKYGDMSLLEQRVGVLVRSTISRISEEFKNIYTGYAFICNGGIYYKQSKSAHPIIYGYGDRNSAKSIFDTKKHHFILIPAVSYEQLVPPERLNTIEAYINVIDGGLIMKHLIEKAGLITLLTVKGPLTIFMPSDEKLKTLHDLPPNKLRAVILAHIVIGRVEEMDNVIEDAETRSTLTDANKIQTMSSDKKEMLSIAQNMITVHRIKGKIVKVVSGNNEGRILLSRASHIDKSPVSRFNGILYRIDSIFTPISETFKMPERSDLDDVITVFDIIKSTMEMRRAQYVVNAEKHQESIEAIEQLKSMYTTLSTEISETSNLEGSSLLQHTHTLIDSFYSKDYPCEEECNVNDDLEQLLREENERFEKLLRVSNKLASLNTFFEKSMLKVARLDQKLHVEHIVEYPSNPDI
jgi:uncharacterized surface protein with fasciclin (FAS1) repeats